MILFYSILLPFSGCDPFPGFPVSSAEAGPGFGSLPSEVTRCGGSEVSVLVSVSLFRGMSGRLCRRLLRLGCPASSAGGWSRLSGAGLDGTGPPGAGRSGLSGGGRMNVFSREMKQRQKDWAAQLQDSQQYDYLRQEVSPTHTPVRFSVFVSPTLFQRKL